MKLWFGLFLIAWFAWNIWNAFAFMRWKARGLQVEIFLLLMEHELNSEGDEMTGLELVRASEAIGGDLTRGNVYTTLWRLEQAGKVVARYEDAPPGEIPRAYYRLSGPRKPNLR